jgi:hypothetical protein
MTGQNHGIDDPEHDDIDTSALASEPTIEGLMAQLSGMMGGEGWAGISDDGQALAKQRSEQTRAMQKQANLFRDVFMTTPQGRELLQLFIDMTIAQPAYPPQAQLPMDVITPLVMVHDAQCNFVREILNAIRMAEKTGAD